MLEQQEANVLQPEKDQTLVFMGHKGTEVGTNNNVPPASSLFFIFYSLLDVCCHVFEVFQLTVMLHLYSAKLRSVKMRSRINNELIT